MAISTDTRDDFSGRYALLLGSAFGCHLSAVITVLARSLNNEERDNIRREYRKMFGKDLVEHLALELSGDLKKSVLLWMQNPEERDAELIKDSLTEAAFNPHSANEVICSWRAYMIQSTEQYYAQKYGITLKNDIKSHTSGGHQKILYSLVTKPRDEGSNFDGEAAVKDAEALYKAGKRSEGTDEKPFIRIFTGRSSAHLAYVASAYADMYGTSLKKAIKKQTKGSFLQCLLIILQPAAYFAKELHKSMKGMGTDDTALIRLIVSRAEIDLPDIKAEYKKKYEKPLQDAVRSATSGDCMEFLLALLG